MHKLRYYFRFTYVFLYRFKGIILIGTINGIICFLLLSVLLPKILAQKTLSIGIAGRYKSDTLPNDIVGLISQGLTKVDSSGIPKPDLADSWETPDRGKTWIFHLKEDIKWQDNKKLVSTDIKYNFSDVQIKYPDSKTINFILNEPYIAFPTIVSRPVFKKGLLGTGDWKVVKVSLSREFIQNLTLVRNKEKLIYKFYPTEDQLKFAYKMGEVNKITKVNNPKPFDKWANSKIENIVDTNQTVVIFFNTQDPLLSEKTVRQALNYAIDKDYFDSERSLSPINPDSFFYNLQVKKYSYDFEKARDLLKDIPNDLKNNLPIKLVSTPMLLTIAEEISKYWKAVGIDTQVLVTSVIPSDYQAYLTIFDIPKDPDQYSLWHSTQGETNITKYRNPRIDKLLEDGRVQENMEERKKIYLDFQRFLIEDSPAIFLYHPIWYNIVRK